MRKYGFIVFVVVAFLLVLSFVFYGDRLTQPLLETPIARIFLPDVAGEPSGLLAEFEKTLLSSELHSELDQYDRSRREPTEQEVQALQAWASQYNITLIGITKSVQVLYESGFDSASDSIDVHEVSGIWQIEETTTKIPETLLAVMDKKTIFVSTVVEPGFTVVKGDTGGKLKNVPEGIILTQPITPQSILREFAHFLDFQGIQGLSVPRNTQLYGLRDKYNAVFIPEVPYTKEIPEGYISSLATANTFENFAEHFVAYILDGDQFRARASKEPELAQKYIFLRDQLFERIEY